MSLTREDAELVARLEKAAYVLWPSALLSDAASRITALSAEIAEWRKVTARNDPADCKTGIDTLYGNWQAAEKRAESVSAQLAECRKERDAQWNLALEWAARQCGGMIRNPLSGAHTHDYASGCADCHDAIRAARKEGK